MKKIIFIVFSVFFISGCKCPECFNLSEPVRIIFLNNSGDNLIDTEDVNPISIHFCDSNVEVPFGIKDYVVNGSVEKTHIELSNERLHEECENEGCCLVIKFEDNTIDTLMYQIEAKESKCCTSFSVSKFSYNNIDYLGSTENTIGAYEIVK